MTDEQIKKREIESALAAIAGGDFLETSTELLAVLGYRSELTEKLWETVDGFIEELPARNKNTKTEQEFRDDAESVELVFQVGSDEIAGSQLTLFESRFDEENEDSFMFFTVELKDKDYPRGKYAQFTREVNKRMVMPVVVFFRVENRLTIGFVGRRPNQLDESKDVLEKVTLIKDIRLNDPYRAHKDILFELSLAECAKWMADHNQPKNFDGLLAAWLARLNTEELNKQFYRKLFHWFEWAVEEAKFPTDKNRTLKPEEHVIRLITRLLFVWFMKEKRLVAEELFNETQVSPLLKDYDHDTGDSYYRAMLQNLFFATLNTEIEKRQFSKGGNPGHRNFSRYRYKEQISDPDKLLKLFVQTPFINGGLFDCLDSEAATEGGGYRIDCFSDVHYKKLSIPNRLFFDKQRGLFPLLEHYKFTVEENTPIEQEVALDPELLGKVFENLLAAYNPETGATARKQTGSYYTPRAIVDYMVEEALIAGLTGWVSPTDGNAKFWEERLYYLFDYAKVFDDASEWFDSRESDEVVRAISELKILDPAVGSGAFPMGALHKLTLALRRLDHDNTRWEQLQKERAIQRAADAFDTKDRQARDEELKEISRIFENYSGNFGRKLYLIQNSIFGLDIQSIACQIAKLRFFISLAIEQEPDRDADNFGIKPLPNLETRFIAANTLIGLEGELTLTSPKAKALEHKLSANRERHFHATTRPQKLACKRDDKKLRRELATELRHIGMPADDADKVADWDPYDQNASADWFDARRMFDVKNGFDVVIGNPPYIKEYTFKHAFDGLRESPYYQGKMDIWYMFACEGIDIIKNGEGVVTFIAQNNWVTSYGASKMRNKIIEDAQVLSLIDFGSFKIFESGIQTMIMIFRKNTDSDSYSFDYRRLHGRDLNINDVMLLLNKSDNSKAEYLTPTIKRSEYAGRSLTFSNSEVELILEKISLKGNLRLNPNKEVAQGIVPNPDVVGTSNLNKIPEHKIIKYGIKKGNGVFVVPKDFFKRLNNYEKNLLRPLYEPSDLTRYFIKKPSSKEIIYITKSNDDKQIPILLDHLEKFREIMNARRENKNGRLNYYHLHWPRDEYFFKPGPKILSVRKCTRPTFTYTEESAYVMMAINVIKSTRLATKYLVGLLNSKLIAFWLKHRGKMQGTNYQIDKQPLLAIPLISPSFEQKASVETLVNQILEAKCADPDADTIALENEIDRLVYSLYDLTPKEIAIVEEAENV